MKPLTERQRQVLDLVEIFHCQHDRPPTLRWLMDMLGIRSLHGIRCHLQALEKKGWIQRTPTQACGILVLHSPPRVVRVGEEIQVLGSRRLDWRQAQQLARELLLVVKEMRANEPGTGKRH